MPRSAARQADPSDTEALLDIQVSTGSRSSRWWSCLATALRPKAVSVLFRHSKDRHLHSVRWSAPCSFWPRRSAPGHLEAGGEGSRKARCDRLSNFLQWANKASSTRPWCSRAWMRYRMSRRGVALPLHQLATRQSPRGLHLTDTWGLSAIHCGPSKIRDAPAGVLPMLYC
jgi:hypothetical protein